MNIYNRRNVPALTLWDYKISVNTACIKNLPDFDYVQILMNPNEKKLALHPCEENAENALRWWRANAEKIPVKISCRVFCAKIMMLMNWKPENRYRIFGNFIRSGKDIVFLFDLNTPEIHETKAAHCSPVIQSEQMNGYTVFRLQKNPINERSEVTT